MIAVFVAGSWLPVRWGSHVDAFVDARGTIMRTVRSFLLASVAVAVGLSMACSPKNVVNDLLDQSSEVVSACEDLTDVSACAECCTEEDDKYNGGAVVGGSTCECTFPDSDAD